MRLTRGEVRRRSRRRVDLLNTTSISDEDYNAFVNDGIRYAHDFLCATLGERYSTEEKQLTVTAGTADYSLDDLSNNVYLEPQFYRLSSIKYRADSGNRYIPLETFQDKGSATTSEAEAWHNHRPEFFIYTTPVGENRVRFSPVPSSGYPLLVKYHTIPQQFDLTPADDDELIYCPEPDLIVVEACIHAQNAEERDPSFFFDERKQIQRRIESWSTTIDKSNTTKTIRTKRNRRFGLQ